jgi:Mg-chelatase subunit ChlD
MQIPKEPIPPNGWGQIAIQFTPKKTGFFNERLKIYHSASNLANIVRLKGSAEFIPSPLAKNCPTFENNAGDKALNNIHSGLVKDAIMGHPITKAEVLFAQNGRAVEYFKTNNSGLFEKELKLGPYSIAVTAKGYDTLLIHHFYVNRNTDPFVFELTPLLETIPEILIEKHLARIENEDINNKTEDNINNQDAPIKTITIEDDTTEIDISMRYPPIPGITDREKDIPKKRYPNDPRDPDSLQLNTKYYAPNNLVFLIDVSKSMKNYNHLELIKKNIIEMIKHLRPNDQLTLMTYADGVKVLTNGRNCFNHFAMIKAVDTLITRGSTQGRKGMKMAYRLAQRHFVKKGNNMIIVASDGGFNSLAQNQRSLYEYIKKQKNKGITLSALGIGKNEKGVFLMQSMVKHGNGNYCHINNNFDNTHVLIDEIKAQSTLENK